MVLIQEYSQKSVTLESWLMAFYYKGIPKTVLEEFLSKYKEPPRICPGCLEEKEAWEIDHKQPVSRGGKTTPANLHFICRECNRQKGNMTWHEFLVYKYHERGCSKK